MARIRLFSTFLVVASTAAVPAYAIPSPELVVGSFSSVSQLLTLFSVAFGGAAVVGTRLGTRGGTGRASHIMGRVALGLLLLGLGSAALNLYQYLDHRSERLARLEATLTRPSREPGAPVLDPTLKEISYREQLSDPHGISTGEVEALLAAVTKGERDDVVFIDIRETVETEMGTLPGATPIRFPDLPIANLDLAGKKPILLCHNGNRSHEICEVLAAMGIDCRFMVGGLEKWLVEGRPLTGLKARTLQDLRAVPPYRNQGVLLETAEVRRLVEKEGAVFVDVRYPGEYAAQHLPNAINLPIRPTPTEQLRARIAELPRRPIIAPCYDRRSCFFGEILGLELERAGHDFRGRYTLPWEYFTPSSPPPHVQQWLEQAQRSPWRKAADAVATAVSWMAERTGFVIAVLLLALASRLLILPFALKAERDQVRTREIGPALADLKARLGSDPPRLARAIRALYRENRLTPMRNLLALLFLPVLALSVTAVNEAAAEHPDGFLWLPNLVERDPTFILPLLFGTLVSLYLDRALARTRRQRTLIWVIGLPLLVAANATLSAAGNLYMVASGVLLLAQRAVSSGQLVPSFVAGLRPRRIAHDDGVIHFADADRLEGCGNKAYRLGRLRAAGMPVPEGLVLTSRFLAAYAAAPAEEKRRRLDALWRRLGTDRIAVRSSAGAEDGQVNSFAGVFDTVLNVDRAGLEAAIATVTASFAAARVESYGAAAAGGNIILQHMVDAAYAGVLFTQAPACSGLALVEMVAGTADRLVAGMAAPAAFSFGRYTGRPVDETAAPIDLAPLLRLGQQAEAIFGAPQDIEWAYCNGRFLLLQSRDITRTSFAAAEAGDRRSRLEAERAHLLALLSGSAGAAAADKVALAQNELSECLPRPTTISLDLMESLWRSGGSIDLACRALGLRYEVAENAPPYLLSVFGRLYVNKFEEQRRAPHVGLVDAMRLGRMAAEVEDNFRLRFLPEWRREMRMLEAIDPDCLTADELLELLERVRLNFVTRTRVETEIISIVASYYLEQARTKLEARGLRPAAYVSDIPDTPLGRATAALSALEDDEAKLAFLRAEIGFRSVLDYELSQPRYGEDPDAAVALLSSLGTIEAAAGERSRRSASNDAWPDRPLFALVDRARRFQALKEEAKHQSLRELAQLRRILLALDARFGLDGMIFHLTFGEIAAIPERGIAEMRTIATGRRKQAELFLSLPSLPAEMTIADLETMPLAAPHRSERPTAGNELAGTLVAGSSSAWGRACVVAESDAERGVPITGFRDGDVIISRFMHPAWLPYFRRASGLVCEIGGWLSHVAILARECDVPMIVGVRGLDTIRDGDVLRLRSDGRIEQVGPAEAATLHALRATAPRQDEAGTAELFNKLANDRAAELAMAVGDD